MAEIFEMQVISGNQYVDILSNNALSAIPCSEEVSMANESPL